MSWNLDFIIWEGVMITRDVTAAVGCRVVQSFFCVIICSSHCKPRVECIVLVTVHVLWIETLSVWFVWARTGLNETSNEWNCIMKRFELLVIAFMWDFHFNVTLLTYPFECPAHYCLYWHTSHFFMIMIVSHVLFHRLGMTTGEAEFLKRMLLLTVRVSWVCVSIWGRKVVNCKLNVNNRICREWECV